ncbi:hypothetical protein CBR_g8610 [Chara braunii]|uniref:D-3-phosphoglycerate dehydrogenase n=1 Tax=Chara braunii TaxID=69332 RepID=A0A388JRZ9_CHABU|nr:hypothetical protein CBR_g8610 [Chara braunii]|eukprot:GBG60589.1 hypothetical protein CBR_g8610 [Chara braunii]
MAAAAGATSRGLAAKTTCSTLAGAGRGDSAASSSRPQPPSGGAATLAVPWKGRKGNFTEPAPAPACRMESGSAFRFLSSASSRWRGAPSSDHQLPLQSVAENRRCPRLSRHRHDKDSPTLSNPANNNCTRVNAVVQQTATGSTSTVSRTRQQGSSAEVTGKPTVLVAEKLGAGGIDLLKKVANVDCSYNLTPEELCAKISLCDALIVRSGTKVTREVFEASNGRLKVVGRAGVGIDNVDLQAATEAGCLVVNAPTANTVAAAEHAIALLLALARNVPQADSSMKEGKWERGRFVGVTLVDKVLAVMGFGKVGSEVARRAKGLGMHVIAHDPYAAHDRARAMGVELVSLEEALGTADFFSLHMPLTSSTERMFNDAVFNKMKDGARIINVARGAVIDTPSLIRALDSGKVAQAALDVFTEEPPPKDCPLIAREDIIVTPHLGASTQEAQEGVAIEIAEAVVGALQGALAGTAVNAPMVPAEVIEELTPYVALAERLAKVAVQLVSGTHGIRGVTITYRSARSMEDLDTRLLRAYVVKGLVEPVSESVVNLVNSDYISKQRGLRITEVRQVSDGDDEEPLETIQLQITDCESTLRMEAPTSQGSACFLLTSFWKVVSSSATRLTNQE